MGSYSQHCRREYIYIYADLASLDRHNFVAGSRTVRRILNTRNLARESLARCANFRQLTSSSDLQEFGGCALTTAKLHHAVWHVPDQLGCQGSGSHFLEFWIERMVRYLKMYLQERAQTRAEITFSNDHLLLKAAQTARSQYPQHCMTLEERQPATLEERFPAYDCLADGARLLGKRTKHGCTDVEKSLVCKLLQKCILGTPEWYAVRGWVPVQPSVFTSMVIENSVVMDKFTRAQLPGLDVMTSSQERNHPTTDNRWLYISYSTSDGSELVCVGLINFFVRVSAGYGTPAFFDPRKHLSASEPDGGGCIAKDRDGSIREAVPLRFAVCQLWHATTPGEAEGAVGLRPRDSPSGEGLPDLLRVQGDLVAALDPDLSHAPSFDNPRGSYYGYHLVNIAEAQAQLCPTIQLRETASNGREVQVRYFLTSSKMSGLRKPK